MFPLQISPQFSHIRINQAWVLFFLSPLWTLSKVFDPTYCYLSAMFSSICHPFHLLTPQRIASSIILKLALWKYQPPQVGSFYRKEISNIFFKTCYILSYQRLSWFKGSSFFWFGLPWYLSSKESTCKCRRHGFNPWSGKTPHAAEQLRPCATILSLCSRTQELQLPKPNCLRPVLCNKRSHCNNKPGHYSWRVERRRHSNEDPAQPNINN